MTMNAPLDWAVYGLVKPGWFSEAGWGSRWNALNRTSFGALEWDLPTRYRLADDGTVLVTREFAEAAAHVLDALYPPVVAGRWGGGGILVARPSGGS